MSKSPAFQFYPGDWLRDEVSGCSLEAQGLWLRLIMIMHDAPIYGQLVLNNEPMSPEFIAKKVGISTKKYTTLLRELDFAGVVNRKENGVIFSGRMERDERARQQNRERQARFKEAGNGDGNGEVTPEITPPSRSGNGEGNAPITDSSSSSSSSQPSVEEEKTLAKPAPEEPPCKPTDTRKSHPALVAVREVVNLFPPKEIWDEVIDQVGFEPDVSRMRKCFSTWVGRGFNRTNYDWLRDWYVNNRIPEVGKNGTVKNGFAKRTDQDVIAESADFYREWEERERSNLPN